MGVLTPHSDAVPESEMWAMVPAGMVQCTTVGTGALDKRGRAKRAVRVRHRAYTTHRRSRFHGWEGLRAVGTIRALEGRLKRPVLSANQVALWQALRLVGFDGRVTEYGSIFTRQDSGQ